MATGTLVRLWGIAADELPGSHDAAQVSRLVARALEEAIPLIDSVTARTSPSAWKSKGTKRSPPACAPVALAQRTIANDTLGRGAESWIARHSVHADASVEGTASWHEFVQHFYNHHVASEEAYTPSIVRARVVRRWEASDEQLDIAGRRWGGFGMCLAESRHRIAPFLLQDRVFSVLQITAVKQRGEVDDDDDDEVVVVSVAVRDVVEGSELARAKGVVLGAYTSVERLARRAGTVEWTMATVSDAKGVLPMWVQTRAVPGQILKDVGLFIGWVREMGG